MAEQTILTEEGLKKLEDELDYLRSEKRQQVAERLKIAISYGDISENSEYDDAKNEQAFVEGRILNLGKDGTQCQGYQRFRNQQKRGFPGFQSQD